MVYLGVDGLSTERSGGVGSGRLKSVFTQTTNNHWSRTIAARGAGIRASGEE